MHMKHLGTEQRPPGSSAEPANVAKQQLSGQRQALVKLMQVVDFGRIEGLKIRDGEPVLDPPPRVVREVKFGGENGPRPEAGAANFLVKAQVLALFRQFEDVGTGTIDLIEVKHGLPFRMLVTER